MSHWYALSDLPAVRAHVRLWWIVHGTPVQVEAVRSWQQRSKSWVWVTLKDGELRPLPPRGREKSSWAPDPMCWQPVSEGWTWPGAIPKPLLPHQVPRLTGASYASQAVSDAEAAEMVREMEGDREAARARNDGHAKPVDDNRWWADATNIRYEPASEVTPRMAEGRVLRALAWCGAWDLAASARVGSSPLKKMAMTAAEAAALAEIEWSDRQHGRVIAPPRFEPLPRDQQDFVTAMAWFTALNPPENWGKRRRAWSLNRTQQVMLMRTLTIPLSWSDIGYNFSISGTRCQQIYAKGMEACWRVANGGLAYPGRRITDQIAALQDRNRTWKRSATA